MAFSLLSPGILGHLGKIGITEPTEPQRDVIPRVLRGESVLLIAPTGIGKTEAAVLPIVESILRTKGKKGFRCLYITPLRALNRDMLRRIENLGDAVGVTVGVRHGDTTQAERSAQSRDPPDILITTPETVQVLFTGKRLREHLKNVEWVVVDEIHELAGEERGSQLSVALERLARLAGDFQRIGLSATVPDPAPVAGFLSGVGREVTVCKHDTHREFDIRVEKPEPVDDKALMDRMQCDSDMLSVMKRAKELMEGGGSTLFFVNTRETAEWIAARYRLWDEGFPIEVHHGSLSKENRVDVEERFKSGELKALVCTSSLELGIDVGSTDLVIQFNSPRQVARMIQRAGRAGHRVGETIRAVIIAAAPDELAESLVIARKCDDKELESGNWRDNPMTVVANQLVAMTMAGRVTRDEALAVFRRAYPFRDLGMAEMAGVLEQLKSIKMVFEDEDGFRRSRKGMRYFYDNISMIPDERSYLIRDIGTRGIVGSLDESFVASFAEPYAMFIAKGRTWRIIEMREDEILVEEVREIGSVPSWTGSDIPVPFEVAMEVGRLRRTMDFSPYPGDGASKGAVAEYVAKHAERSPVPSDELVTMEIGDRLVIVNACFGTKVNETLSKIYAALLTARLGESVAVTTDPYRMIFQMPRDVGKNVLLDTMRSIVPGSVESLARLTIVNSAFLRWRFVYVAKKFGIIEKGADHRFMNFTRLFEIHQGTPAYEEALNKTLHEDLDIANSERVVGMLWAGEIGFETCQVSHIGMEGITRSKELMQPPRADHAILMALKNRLEDEVLYATCVNCSGQWRVRVGNAPKRFRCENCGGHMVALLKHYERDAAKLLRKKGLDAEEEKAVKKIYRTANLVLENGDRAALVLAGRGIGPEAASRILRTLHVDEDGFLRSILEAEVLFAKYKRFWD
ncbi:MAG: DEAD/DEAH box helicase [Thermoplasmatales archaeon]|nr:DEAD/DEAH box helicase [Thermoplasmatales archaeon]